MAVTVTPVFAGTTFATFDVEATADADVAAVIPHGLGAAPLEVTIIPQLAAAYLSNWLLGVVDAVNVNLGCTAAVGSGAVGSQIRVHVSLPHSIVR